MQETLKSRYEQKKLIERINVADKKLMGEDRLQEAVDQATMAKVNDALQRLKKLNLKDIPTLDAVKNQVINTIMKQASKGKLSSVVSFDGFKTAFSFIESMNNFFTQIPKIIANVGLSESQTLKSRYKNKLNEANNDEKQRAQKRATNVDTQGPEKVAATVGSKENDDGGTLGTIAQTGQGLKRGIQPPTRGFAGGRAAPIRNYDPNDPLVTTDDDAHPTQPDKQPVAAEKPVPIKSNAQTQNTDSIESKLNQKGIDVQTVKGLMKKTLSTGLKFGGENWIKRLGVSLDAVVADVIDLKPETLNNVIKQGQAVLTPAVADIQNAEKQTTTQPVAASGGTVEDKPSAATMTGASPHQQAPATTVPQAQTVQQSTNPEVGTESVVDDHAEKLQTKLGVKDGKAIIDYLMKNGWTHPKAQKPTT